MDGIISYFCEAMVIYMDHLLHVLPSVAIRFPIIFHIELSILNWYNQELGLRVVFCTCLVDAGCLDSPCSLPSLSGGSCILIYN